MIRRIFFILAVLLTSVFIALGCIASNALKAGDVDPKSGKKIKYWVAPMDPTYIRNEPGKSPMGMDLVIVYEEVGGEKEPSSTIRIDPVTMQNMGVRTAPVKRQPLAKNIRALGYINYDETRIYAVNLKFDGWIETLFVDFVGETIAKGQKLFDIYSPELVSAQQEYLLAFNQVKSFKDSPYASIKNNAARLLEASHTRLSYWDLNTSQIRSLQESGSVSKTLTVFSPAKGVVIKKEAIAGHFAKAGTHLYEIADLSRVWVDVEIFEYELPYIRKGMDVEMELSYLPGKRFSGKVLFIYPFLSPKTRTVKLRLIFENTSGHLKPEMYANVFLSSSIDDNALVVPQEAVIDSGVKKIVFLSRGKGRFEPREIEIGAEGSNNNFQVLSGLNEGDEIVISAQFMFDSESRLREAIQKMLEARNGKETLSDDLDMEDMGMEDLSMDDMKMDDMDMSDLSVDQ